MLCGWLYPDEEIYPDKEIRKKRNAPRSKLEDYCRKQFHENITEYHPLSERPGNEPFLYTGISTKKVKTEQDKGEDYVVAFGWFKGDSLKRVAVISSARLNKILTGELEENGFEVSKTNDDQRYLIHIYATWDMWEDVPNA